MRTIAVMEAFNEKNFNNYLSFILGMLNIQHSFQGIEDLKNMELDYVILNSSEKARKEVNIKAGCCFANMDNSLQGNINIYGNMVTYGFGVKNTVTVSSLEDNNEGFVYCLQRYLNLRLEGALEPQEIPVSLKFDNDAELYAAMVAITIALLEGVSPKDIEKKLAKKLLVLT